MSWDGDFVKIFWKIEGNSNGIMMGYGIIAIILLVRKVGNEGMGWWLIGMDWISPSFPTKNPVSHGGFKCSHTSH